MTELKPCPFCGGEFAYNNDVGPEDAYLEEWWACTRCGARVDSKEHSQKRVSPWRSLKDDPPEPNSGWRQVFLRHADGYVKIAELGDDTDITVTGEAWAEGVPELLEKYNFVSWMEVPQ